MGGGAEPAGQNRSNGEGARHVAAAFDQHPGALNNAKRRDGNAGRVFDDPEIPV